MKFISTGQLAELLRVRVHRLEYLTRDHQLRPLKGPTGAFMWTHAEACRAAKLLQVPMPAVDQFDGLTVLTR